MVRVKHQQVFGIFENAVIISSTCIIKNDLTMPGEINPLSQNAFEFSKIHDDLDAQMMLHNAYNLPAVWLFEAHGSQCHNDEVATLL